MKKKILTLNYYEQAIVSRSVAVMYKLSWYVIPLCEPNTGLIDLKHVVFLYYSNLLSVYIWYDLRNILMCVFYKSLIWLRSLPCASFISRALMCLSTWVCAIGSCFWVFVYCYLIKDRLPCRSTLSEHCNWKQHTVIVADTLMQVPSNFDVK